MYYDSPPSALLRHSSSLLPRRQKSVSICSSSGRHDGLLLFLFFPVSSLLSSLHCMPSKLSPTNLSVAKVYSQQLDAGVFPLLTSLHESQTDDPAAGGDESVQVYLLLLLSLFLASEAHSPHSRFFFFRSPVYCLGSCCCARHDILQHI